MDPFDVENIFVFFQGHIEIDLLELRSLLIFRKFLLPGLLAHRRNGSANWIPFGDGQSRAGEAYKSPKDHQKCDEEGKDEKPIHHSAIALGTRVSRVMNRRSANEFDT